MSDCSGLIDNETKCKHGFPVYPGCKRDPMKKGIYKTVPCLDEKVCFRLFPETGIPESKFNR